MLFILFISFSIDSAAKLYIFLILCKLFADFFNNLKEKVLFSCQICPDVLPVIVGTSSWFKGWHTGLVLVEQELHEDILRAILPIEDDLDIRRHGDDLVDGARFIEVLDIRRSAYGFLES